MALCILVVGTTTLEKHTAPIFRVGIGTHLQNVLKMKVEYSSETSVPIYQTAGCHNSEYDNLSVVLHVLIHSICAEQVDILIMHQTYIWEALGSNLSWDSNFPD
jgi:hypothetical protein